MAKITSISIVAREIAKKWFFARRIMLWLILLCGLVAIFLDQAVTIGISEKNIPDFELIIAVVSILIQIIGAICFFRASYLHHLSREGIRQGMLIDSFGYTDEHLDLAYLTQKFTTSMEKLAEKQQYLYEYYSSKQNYGPARLKDNLQESAFFTADLFKRAGWRSLYFLAIPAVVVLLFSFLLPFIEGEENISLARALIIIMVFFCFSGGTAECVNLFSASSKSLAVDRRLERFDDPKDSIIYAAFTDYYVTTELAPPISTKLYNKHKLRLNENWEKRKSKEI